MNLYFYSTNPKFSHELVEKYLNHKHNIWCTDRYDGGPRSSSPYDIFISLQKDCEGEDTHSDLIKRYKKTFRKLVAVWVADNRITEADRAEIIALINAPSWNIWRPQLYIICRSLIANNRLKPVPAAERASTLPEWKIEDLDTSEFEIIERII